MGNLQTMTTVSENIQDLLRLHNVRQQQLAEKTGLKQSAISRLLTDPDANPTVLTLEKIASAFGVEVSDLLRKKRKKVAC
jgi:transcriptional regulator with XRE-family HTH domain